MITRRSSRRAVAIVAANEDVIANEEPKTEDPKVETGSKPSKATHSRPKQRGQPRKGQQKRERADETLEIQSQSDDQPIKKPKSADGSPVAKILTRSPINFSIDEFDPVIHDLKKTFASRAIEDQGDIAEEVLDHIALEGLSGITFSRLLQIIGALFPKLECLEDQRFQHYIWSLIVGKFLNYPPDSNIEAFYLDPEHKNENSVTRGGLVIEKQLKLSDQTIKRMPKIDMIYPIQEGAIIGSCRYYTARIDITNDIIEKATSGDISESLYTAHDQYGIENIIFVACPTLRAKAILPNWADPSVDIKLREYCALELIGRSRTLGTVFPNDKTFGRYRIMLEAKGFITQYQPTNFEPIQHLLKRFTNINYVCNKDAKARKQSSSSDDEEDYKKSQPLSILCCNPGKMKADRGALTMVYDVIAAEPNGITQFDIRRRLRLPKFHIRNHLKNLISIKMICSYSLKDPEKPFRFYKAAYTSTRERKRAKKEPIEEVTGIMASWDEADLRAKKMIGHKRSSFSQAEDSLLILCRITSLLIDPNLKLSWCVHKRVVRDLLHVELIDSHDKTSDACLRRIKYLKRLPNNIMSINELTAELRDDLDIVKLTHAEKQQENDKRRNKLFHQILKVVRAKIPNLLGITLSSSAPSSSRGILGRGIKKITTGEAIVRPKENVITIDSYQELREKYDLIDCQSVASIKRAPTYDQAKNLVDIKFNTVSLVTMAFTITTCLEPIEDLSRKRANQWLLEKFYSSHHDRLVSSVISKLNKRSLLTRKCPPEQASLYKPKTKMSLKLNQTVLFLLNRFQSSSLMQLAHPISQLYGIDLSESNEMASIALLTSLCSLSSFNLELELKIPTNIVAIDQGNESFKSLCEKANQSTREVLARFMSRRGERLDAIIPDNTTCNLGPIIAPHGDEDQSTSLVTLKPAIVPAGPSSSGSSGSTSPPIVPSTDSSSVNVSGRSTHSPSSSLFLGGKPESEVVSFKHSSSGANHNKMDDSRRALFLLRHELKAHTLDKCGSLSDCLIVQPCNVRFSSDSQLESADFDPLEAFFAKHAILTPESAKSPRKQQQQKSSQSADLATNCWLVKSFQMPNDLAGNKGKSTHEQQQQDKFDLKTTTTDFEAKKKPVEFYARLWKRIDGSVHKITLLKLIESLLGWIVVYPGIERNQLSQEFNHLMPEEHLFELLHLMEELSLISSSHLPLLDRKPGLFGYREGESDNSLTENVTTFQASAGAFVKYCQLLSRCK